MFRRLAGALASVIFGYASYWSVRLAIADHFARDHSATAIERAIRLAPNNPEYYLRLADVSPPAAPAAIERAVELNPLNSSVWLERAQVAEDRKDYPAAETYLLRAVELDRTLAPRWSLTAYYFRRHAPQRFWPAVRAALDVSYDDVTPLFEMCWKLAPEPARILHDAIPARPAVLRQYLDFLLAQNRPDLAAPVVKQLLQNPAPDSLGSLLDYCDLLLSKGNLSPAPGDLEHLGLQTPPERSAARPGLRPQLNQLPLRIPLPLARIRLAPRAVGRCIRCSPRFTCSTALRLFRQAARNLRTSEPLPPP